MPDYVVSMSGNATKRELHRVLPPLLPFAVCSLLY